MHLNLAEVPQPESVRNRGGFCGGHCSVREEQQTDERARLTSALQRVDAAGQRITLRGRQDVIAAQGTVAEGTP